MMNSIFWIILSNTLISCRSDQSAISCNQQLEVDVAILLDISSGVCDNDPTTGSGTCSNFENLKGFVSYFVDSLTTDRQLTQHSQVAVVTAGDDANVLWLLNKFNTKHDLLGAIMNTIVYPANPSPTADLEAALTLTESEVFTVKNGDRSNSSNIVLLLTTGQVSGADEDIISASNRLISTGAVVITVGIPPLTDTTLICAVASPPSPTTPHQRNCYSAPSINTLRQIALSLC